MPLSSESAALAAQQPWYQEALALPTAAGALRAFARGIGTILARVGALDDVVRSALHEPEAVAVHTRSEDLRRGLYRTVIEHLAARFGLREGIDADAATDILLMLAGPSAYRTMVLDYGWRHDAYIEWLTRTLIEMLVPYGSSAS